jgi:hypothetical protein
LFLEDSRVKVQNVIIESGYSEDNYDDLYKLYNQNFVLVPFEFYAELGRVLNGVQESTVRLTFKVDTQIKIADLKARFSPTGIKINTGIVEATSQLSIARIDISKKSTNYFYKPIELALSSKKKFEIRDLFLSGGVIDTILITKELDGKMFHKATNSLIVNNCYELKIKVLNTYPDFFEKIILKSRNLK